MATEYSEHYKVLGLNIAYYRKAAGLTQEGLAEKIGVSTGFLGQVEATGVAKGISLHNIYKIADVLKIPPYKLFKEH